MYPNAETIKNTREYRSYKRVPVAREIYADFITPIEAAKILKNVSGHVFLLESVEDKERWGRYSFLGFNPALEITCSENTVTLRDDCGKKTLEGSPQENIRKIIARYKSPRIEGMPPFTGGLVGYFSYDYIRHIEKKLKFTIKGDDFKDMDLMLFDSVIAFDSFKQKIILITGVYTDDIDNSCARAEKTLDDMEKLLKNGKKASDTPLKLHSRLTHDFSEKTYCDMVEKAKKHIREGDIFQAVLSNPIRAKAEGSLFDTYRALRVTNPSPYMFYFSGDDMEIAGASPETLVKLENRRLYTYPLAGSRPRGKTRDEDKRLEEELLRDEKELAEHNMLVDLGRNDIGKISETGSVQVDEYLNIVRYSHIMHISSTVSGKIREDKDAIDAIDAILPAGTLSGAPKIRACEIINELEGKSRGIYGGAIGYLDFAGNMDVCIAIRLVYKKNGEVCVRSGAGIVYDSEPDKEFAECSRKAQAVINAIKEAEGGLI